jgi:hypothetical protein
VNAIAPIPDQFRQLSGLKWRQDTSADPVAALFLRMERCTIGAFDLPPERSLDLM